jgi:hypothetical protein
VLIARRQCWKVQAPELRVAWYTVGTCGACIAFLQEGQDERGPTGRCRLRPELKVFTHTLPRCGKYVERETFATWKAPKAARPRGAPIRPEDDEVIIEKAPVYGATIDLGGDDMNSDALKALIRDVLVEEGVLGVTEMGKRWEGGMMILKPGAEGQQPKEIPIDGLFHKIVMVRDKLRVLEQKINAHTKLSDTEKVDMQQYVTRCYGSLTTFNVLFKDKDDHFVGSKTD